MKLFWRQSGPSFTHKVTREFIEKPKVLMHMCMHDGCDQWGSQSIGAAWMKGKPGRWYCAAHIKEAETSQEHTAPVIETEANSEEPGSYNLFGDISRGE